MSLEERVLLADATERSFRRVFSFSRWFGRRVGPGAWLGSFLARTGVETVVRDSPLPAGQAVDAVARAIEQLGEVIERRTAPDDDPWRIMGLIDVAYFSWQIMPVLVEATFDRNDAGGTRIGVRVVTKEKLFGRPKYAERAMKTFLAALDSGA